MVKLIKRLSKKIGLQPGTVVYIGEQRHEPVTINVINYNKDSFQQVDVKSVEECFQYKGNGDITWININGIHDINIIEKIGQHFDIHPLILEDIANAGHRPKMEDWENFVFATLKMIYFDKEEELKSEQFSIVFGDDYVISFQEVPGDVFDSVRERLKKTTPRTRFLGTDYLTYSLIDAIVDSYFLVLENLGDRLEDFQEEVVSNPQKEGLQTIYDLKRELVYIRKVVWPLRELVGGFERSESSLFHDYTSPYIRDLYEHTMQVIDTVETFRDMVGGLLDIYLSSVSNRMNEVMKVLTIIATIFIPLGFLAGVYGMNFNTSISPYNLPELDFRYGYIFFWLVALFIAGALFLFFRKKKWL